MYAVIVYELMLWTISIIFLQCNSRQVNNFCRASIKLHLDQNEFLKYQIAIKPFNLE